MGYGDLEKILVITLPTNPFFANLSAQIIVLALVTPWDTNGKDASKEDVYMTTRKASFITDIRSLQSVIGIVETRNKWGIIDRSGESVVAEFAEDKNGTLDSDNGLL